MKRTAGIFLLLLLLCSCGKNDKKIKIDLLSFVNFSFSAASGTEVFKGDANYVNGALSVDIREPAELKNLSFSIDASGIRCSQDGVEGSYIRNDFSDEFLFYGLYDLITDACAADDFERSGDGYVFSDEKNEIVFDQNGKPVSAKINGFALLFT
ncbi:MAG: hypothetical protein IJU45_03540 [Clostridia bacterium]|nr:hypothetical protein [Clostridia bacterium]